MPDVVAVDEEWRLRVPKEFIDRARLKPGDKVLIGMEGRKIIIIPAKVVPVSGA